jgi:very-short-patch-repair endonuclease
LVIEIDGTYHTHDLVSVKDDIRDQKLAEWNLNTLRFSEGEVRMNRNNVLLQIENYTVDAQETNAQIIAKAARKSNPPNPL